MAADEGLDGLANMILLGRFLADCLPLSEADVKQALEQAIPPQKRHLIEANLRAVALGRERAPQTCIAAGGEKHRLHPRRAG